MMDAVQVRCPGCTPQNTGAPTLYQGMTYGPNDPGSMIAIAGGANAIGAPLVVNSGMPNQKFTFVGSALADFTDSTMWIVSAPDMPGLPPASLGYVDSALYAAVMNHTLGLPCCGNGNNNNNNGNRKMAKTGTDTGNVNNPLTQLPRFVLYPNPNSGSFTIQSNIGGIFSLYTIEGARLQEYDVISGTTYVQLPSGIAAGVFLGSFKPADGSRIQNMRIIYEKQ